MSIVVEGTMYFMYRCRDCGEANWRPITAETTTRCDFCGKTFVCHDHASKYNLDLEKDMDFKDRMRRLAKLVPSYQVFIYDDFAVYEFDKVGHADRFFNFIFSRTPLFQGLIGNQRFRHVCVMDTAGIPEED